MEQPMSRPRRGGFSLVELLVVTLIFTAITGAIFGLFAYAQTRFKTESEFLDTFQGSRVAIDQIVRDIHSAGYPPTNLFTAAQAAANPQLLALSFAWTPNYPGTPCTLGSTCTVPSGFDIIVETNVDPQSSTTVEWVRYRLNGTNLERGQATKTAGADPAATTLPTMSTYVENVMNNPGAAEITSIQTSYPTLFPGNAAVPVFTYAIDSGQSNDPTNIREVNITLMVQSPNIDPVTGQKRILALTAQARRENPRK
jgi:type II secretory pathway pseudopilin PulG